MLRAEMVSERLSFGVVTALPAIRNRFPGAHDRSLSRSVRSVLSDLSAVEKLSMVAIASAGRSARGGYSEGQGERLSGTCFQLVDAQPQIGRRLVQLAPIATVLATRAFAPSAT